MPNTTAPTYTHHEATDEAVLKLLHKLRFRHQAAFAAVWGQLPEGAREALGNAERRAHALRCDDEAKGIPLCTRPYPTVFVTDDDEPDA